ncbi:hypothetical protein [Methylobacterium gnaphalii]|uniref:Uncharacterized protein n=1 Tax=Methylobacterium gnaphalii TaxID=1010610 RepID=A0A512JPA3_9HYPH|nr:hypothetical protein [Methylobacterium gnaphalii]GEP11781.1 hypothetical protein MGN01_36260 [Methylobacterium gnaphalii]GJD69458.1 hypothetical protein MMMDOFMJ_2389 [Methylobacterium gnaphalii]GLS49584.1 hypothetical protein GCM10007885_24330 [Methylobacterium gnaphalii]
MRVKPFTGRNGDPVCSIDGALGLFNRRGQRPIPGVEIEVMITHHTPIKYPAANVEKYVKEGESLAGGTIGALIVQPITDDHVLVAHKGFECAGTMCRTMASLTQDAERELYARHRIRLSWLTPGMTPVREASNVNVGWSYRDEAGTLHIRKRVEPTPGLAYVSLTDLREHHRRIAGVPDLGQLEPWISNMLARRGSRSTAQAEARP